VEELGLVRDFALIMAVAGGVMLLFRKLRQPPVLGYLIAGVIIGPYTLSTLTVTDIDTIRLLADLGLVLLLFGLGLEFSWSKIRQIGLAALIIGVAQTVTMICIGYGLGQLLGWTTMDSVFLGAALNISSTAIIAKILGDLGKLDLLSSRLIIGILVVEDFAAVVILSVLSGIASTGTADLGDIGSLILRLVTFVAASLALGAIIVPRIISFTRQFHSKEVLLITSLGLCFGMALLGNYLGLSVAAGAFLMGALIGDTKHSEEVVEVVSPVRDMFAALFFVTIGMLIDMAQFRDFLVPAIIVTAVFILSKILSNTLATFFCGYDGRTSLQVGMGRPVMGEFSLAIAKLGVDRGLVTAPLYPVVAVVTTLTSLAGPYIMRSADSVAHFLDQRAPMLLKVYVSRLSDWLQALRTTFARDSATARKVRHSLKITMINLLIVVVIISIGTFALQSVTNLSLFKGIRADFVGLGVGLVVLVLCLPSFIAIWRNLRSLVDEAVTHVLSRRPSAGKRRSKALRIILRDSILIGLSIFVAMWFIPFVSGLLNIGSFALAIPLLLLALLLYLVLNSIRHIHHQLEQNFSQVLLGEKYTSTSVEGPSSGISQDSLVKMARKVKLRVVKKDRNRHRAKGKVKQPTGAYRLHSKESVDTTEEADSQADDLSRNELKGDSNH
jgi:CPA2 family monovalent cation:H+ antiporter-2